MTEQGKVLTKEQYSGAPIERAHLHRGFKSSKTALKWIRFFRACVLQRQVADEKRKKKNKKTSIIGLIVVLVLVVGFIFSTSYQALFMVFIVATIISIITINDRSNKKFKTNYTEGFDFFSDYFSAFFTLIEEELGAEATIALDINLKEIMSKENLVKKKRYIDKRPRFISGATSFYKMQLGQGSCVFKDGSIVSFNFTQRLRARTIERKSASGNYKTKHKYSSVYPFTIKMKLPKDKYFLKNELNKTNINLAEDDNFFIIKTVRKFDIKNEKPDKYTPYSINSIQLFSSDYFSLEIINLINSCYSCIVPKA